jgi:hypothetical protein
MAKKYSYLPWTVRTLVNSQSKIDTNPVHQRLARGLSRGDNKKYIEIVESMLHDGGQSTGQITLNHLPANDGGDYEFAYEYESIDGGHRKRAILGFVDNQFKIEVSKGKYKYFKDFSKAEQEEFYDIEIPMCIYENLSGRQKAKIFRDLNKSTQVNEQENRNAAGDTPLANAIRCTVREVDGFDENCHNLFKYEVKVGKSAVKFNYSYVGFNNNGLAQEEWVARLFLYYINGQGNVVTTDHGHLDHLYDSNPSEAIVDKAATHVHGILTFIEKMAKCRNRHFPGVSKMPVKEANLFVRLRYHMLNEYGNTISFRTDTGHTDYDFYVAVRAIYDDIIDNYSKQFVWNGFDSRNYDGNQTIGEKFSKNLNEYRYDYATLMFPVQMILSKLDLKEYFKIKDPIRTASLKMREQLYREQEGKCAATGVEAAFEDMECDHTIPHELGIDAGGITEKHNLKMVLKSYNRNKSNKVMA